MRPVIGHLAVVAFVLTITMGTLVPSLMNVRTGPNTTGTNPSTPALHPLTRFASTEEFQQWVIKVGCNQSVSQGFYNPFPRTVVLPPNVMGTSAPGVLTFATDSTRTTTGFSTTNVQVGGVDELDMVKTDGTYLYTVSNNTVAIVLAFPATDAHLLARVSVNGAIRGIFIDGTRLAVITESYPLYYPGWLPPPSAGVGLVQSGGIVQGGLVGRSVYMPYFGATTSSVSIFNIADHTQPVLTTTLKVNGTLAGARLIGNYAYLIASQNFGCYGPVLPPMIMVNNGEARVAATDVYHSDIADYGNSFTTVVGIDILQTNPVPSSKTFLIGTSGTIFVSPNQIYLTQPIWDQTEGTALYRIAIDGSNIDYQASGNVRGHVLNQFSMDEYNGYFRVATNDYRTVPSPLLPAPGPIMLWSQSIQETNIYVLDKDSLNIKGSLEGLSPNESFYAARFMGEKAYLVTYQRMDPLFVISLHDPTKPVVLGQLVIDGVSDYLQPYDDTHLIGFGKSSTNVTWENAALFQGLKLSLFDVSDPTNPKDTSDFFAGDRGSDSPALTDHTAVLLDKGLNLLVIPVEIAKIQSQQDQTNTGGLGIAPNPWAYGTPTWQGVYVFDITVPGGIVFRGGITHLPAGQLPSWNNQSLFVKRALYISNVLYTVSDNEVMMNSISDLSQIGTVSLV